MYKTFLAIRLPRPLQIMKTIDCRSQFHQKPKMENPALPSLHWSTAQNCQGSITTHFIVEGYKWRGFDDLPIPSWFQSYSWSFLSTRNKAKTTCLTPPIFPCILSVCSNPPPHPPSPLPPLLVPLYILFLLFHTHTHTHTLSLSLTHSHAPIKSLMFSFIWVQWHSCF